MARRKKDAKAEALEEHGALNHGASRVRDPQFHTGIFFDPRDAVQVKYEMLRRTERDGWSATKAAAEFGFSRATFYVTKAAFEREGLTGLLPKKPGPRGPHKLTDEVLDFVDQLRTKRPGVRSQELSERVRAEFGISVHPRTIERAAAPSRDRKKN